MATFGCLKEGTLTKQGRNVKSWRRRHFLLQGNVLYYFASERDSACRGFILFNDVARVEERSLSSASVGSAETGSGGGRPNMIAIVCPNRTLLAQAETAADAADWARALRTLVKLHSYRTAFVAGAGAWGVAERQLARIVDHGRRVVELLVQVTGHLRAVALGPQRREQAQAIRERATAIGADGVVLADALLNVIRAPFALQARSALNAVLRRVRAACEATLPAAKGTSEDELLQAAVSRLATETASLLADDAPPDPRAEVLLGVEKLRQALLEAGEDGAAVGALLASTGSRFSASCQAVAESLAGDPRHAQLHDIAREAPTVVQALCTQLRSESGGRGGSALSDLNAYFSRVRNLVGSLPPVEEDVLS